MENNPSGNKRIAKNTLLLYFRMLLTILVGLYTSRVVLNTLGISDYGVYIRGEKRCVSKFGRSENI